MDKIFLKALVISFFLHSFLIFPWPVFRKSSLFQSLHELEISYFQINQPTEKIKPSPAPSPSKIEVTPRQKIPEKFVAEEKFAQKREKKQESKKQTLKTEQNSPSLTKEELLVAKDLASLGSEPVFLEYYRAIRERIKIFANRNRPAFFSPGEVYLFFILESNGNLSRLKIIEEKSTRNPILCGAAIKSLEEASPFPPFPQELNRNQIAFSIIIAFEVR